MENVDRTQAESIRLLKCPGFSSLAGGFLVLALNACGAGDKFSACKGDDCEPIGQSDGGAGGTAGSGGSGGSTSPTSSGGTSSRNTSAGGSAGAQATSTSGLGTDAGGTGGTDNIAGAAGQAGETGSNAECSPGATRSCAEAGLLGACAEGTQTCDDSGMWGECSVLPAEQDGCDTGDDDDCNGIANEGCPCVAGDTRSCGDAGALGSCAAGTQTCTGEGAWGSCNIVPAASDACEPDNDADCDGNLNENCLCINGVTTRPCGACEDGTQVCTNGKTNQYGTCTGATGVPTVYYRDLDGDGYGSSVTTTSCDGAPAGYASQSGDCCDDGGNLELAAQINPDQTEYFTSAAAICGITWDYDCSGEVEFSRQALGVGCVTNTTCPTCATAYRSLVVGDCGVNAGSSIVCQSSNCNMQGCWTVSGPVTTGCR